MVVGNYGSGKTEVAVNLAVLLSKTGSQVQIADLDIVNPYFRCREAQDLMEQHNWNIPCTADTHVGKISQRIIKGKNRGPFNWEPVVK